MAKNEIESRAQQQEWNGNRVLACKESEWGLPVLLLEITNPDWDSCGFFAVAVNMGFNAREGFDEWDYSFFEFFQGALEVFESEGKFTSI